ncbi:MAG: TIGR02281 family clan AA aspartic protease [Spongiibacteraceae bacterium]
MKLLFKLLLVATGVTVALAADAATRVEAQALMKNSAILRIDQEQRLLRTGQRSPEGVLLVSASPREAVVEIDGRRSTLNLSNRIAGTFEEPDQSEVQIPRNDRHQYITTATINGRRNLVLVDTGANSVALNSIAADRLGLDYQKRGTPIMVSTASGVAQGYSVVLDKIVIGEITASYVDATVIVGSFPTHILLGTTFLQHVGMREENGIMYLRQKY